MKRITRLLGEDNKEDSRLCFQFSTWAILTFGVIVLRYCISGLQAAPASQEVPNAELYIFLGAPFIMLSSGYAHLFRSAALIREATVGVIIGKNTDGCPLCCLRPADGRSHCFHPCQRCRQWT